MFSKGGVFVIESFHKFRLSLPQAARNYRIKQHINRSAFYPAQAETTGHLPPPTDLFSSSLRQVDGKAGEGSIINF
jgi:hypothetical protein